MGGRLIGEGQPEILHHYRLGTGVVKDERKPQASHGAVNNRGKGMRLPGLQVPLPGIDPPEGRHGKDQRANRHNASTRNRWKRILNCSGHQRKHKFSVPAPGCTREQNSATRAPGTAQPLGAEQLVSFILRR